MVVTTEFKSVFKDEVQIVFIPAISGNCHSPKSIEFDQRKPFFGGNLCESIASQWRSKHGSREGIDCRLFHAKSPVDIIHQGIIRIHVLGDHHFIFSSRSIAKTAAIVMIIQSHFPIPFPGCQVVESMQHGLIKIRRHPLVFAASGQSKTARSCCIFT